MKIYENCHRREREREDTAQVGSLNHNRHIFVDEQKGIFISLSSVHKFRFLLCVRARAARRMRLSLLFMSDMIWSRPPMIESIVVVVVSRYYDDDVNISNLMTIHVKADDEERANKSKTSSLEYRERAR
jgi:hypothetical protein